MSEPAATMTSKAHQGDRAPLARQPLGLYHRRLLGGGGAPRRALALVSGELQQSVLCCLPMGSR